jgi:hypothetical protein
MTLIDSNVGNNNVGVFLYRLIAPATGTHLISTSGLNASSQNNTFCGISFTNADQTTPEGTVAKVQSQGASSLSVSPASTTNDIMLGAAGFRNDTGTTTVSAGSGETDQNNQFKGTGASSIRGITVTKAGAASSTTLTETANASQPSAMSGLAIHGVTSSAGLVVSGNKVKSSGASAASAYWLSQTDGKAHLRIDTLPASGERISIVVRGATGQNGYRLDLVNVGGTISQKLVRVTSGAELTLATSATRTWTAGERVGIIISGATIKGYYLPVGGAPSTDTWPELTSGSDSTFTSSGRWGIEIIGTTVIADEWYYSSVIAPAPVGRSTLFPFRLKIKAFQRTLFPYTVGLAHVGLTRRTPYSLKNRIPGIRRTPYRIGLAVFAEDINVRCGSVTLELYNALGPLAYADDQNDFALYKLCCTIGGMLQEVEDLSRDLDGYPGWAKLVNLPTTPEGALDWLGQFAGVKPQGGLTYDQKVQRIAEHEGFARGTLGAIRSAGTLFLTGNKTVGITERFTSAYTLRVSTIPTETPYPQYTYLALIGQKPAGIVLTYVNFTGQTWLHLKQTYATWALATAHYANWDNLSKDI